MNHFPLKSWLKMAVKSLTAAFCCACFSFAAWLSLGIRVQLQGPTARATIATLLPINTGIITTDRYLSVKKSTLAIYQ